MIEIIGKAYLTDKEASCRYGLSRSWFQHRRWERKEPKYVQITPKGRALYPLEETDQWFKKRTELNV